MTFLTDADFELSIRADQLDKITKSNPALLSVAVNVALDEVSSYLAARYDLDATFTAVGDDRNIMLVTRLVDMALYHLYSRISPNNIPDLRRDRYLEATDLFKGAQKGNRFLSLPVKPIEDQSNYFLFGSTKPYQNYI